MNIKDIHTGMRVEIDPAKAALRDGDGCIGEVIGFRLSRGMPAVLILPDSARHEGHIAVAPQHVIRQVRRGADK